MRFKILCRCNFKDNELTFEEEEKLIILHAKNKTFRLEILFRGNIGKIKYSIIYTIENILKQ